MAVTEEAVWYGPRRKVVVRLLRLLYRELTARERRVLLAYCGFYEGGPLRGRALASRFPPEDGVTAEQALRQAIGKVRRAIPRSTLRRYVRRIPAAWSGIDS